MRNHKNKWMWSRWINCVVFLLSEPDVLCLRDLVIVIHNKHFPIWFPFRQYNFADSKQPDCVCTWNRFDFFYSYTMRSHNVHGHWRPLHKHNTVSEAQTVYGDLTKLVLLLVTEYTEFDTKKISKRQWSVVCVCVCQDDVFTRPKEIANVRMKINK